MNRLYRFFFALVYGAMLLQSGVMLGNATAAQAAALADAPFPELAYLKQVNLWRPPSDPQIGRAHV